MWVRVPPPALGEFASEPSEELMERKLLPFEEIETKAARELRKFQARQSQRPPRPRFRRRHPAEWQSLAEWRNTTIQRRTESIRRQVQEFGQEEIICSLHHTAFYFLEIGDWQFIASKTSLAVIYSPAGYEAELNKQFAIIQKTVAGYDDQTAQIRGVKEAVGIARIFAQSGLSAENDGIPIRLSCYNNQVLYCRGEDPVVERFFQRPLGEITQGQARTVRKLLNQVDGVFKQLRTL